MKRKATQKEIFHALNGWLESYGVTRFEYLECGCKTVVFSTGGTKKERCWKHKYEIPRECPCGYCRELSQMTAEAFRLGNLERAEALRKMRAAHECEGVA